MLMGYLGKDPELKYLQSTSVGSVPLATTEYWTKDGTKHETTEWHNIVAWGKTAELLTKYCHKGDCILVEGKIQTRSWENQQGGKSYKTEVVIDKITFVTSKSSQAPSDAHSTEQHTAAVATAAVAASAPTDYSDVPF